MIGIQPQAKIKSKVRKDMGMMFARMITDAQHDRDKRMKDVWAKAQENYEGIADTINFPWKNASNAFIPLTSSHTDAWRSRLYNAATAQDPVYITSGWGPDALVPGVNPEQYAEDWNEYSKWLEAEEIPNHVWMEKVTTVLTKYGNAIVYVAFEHEYIMDVTIDESGEEVKEKLDLLNKPVLHVIHPKNFYMPSVVEDVQESPWCGFDVEYTPDEVRTRITTEEWDVDAAKAILAFHTEKTTKELKKDKKPPKENYYQEDQGKYQGRAAYEAQQAKTLHMPQKYDMHVIPMVRVFARYDVDLDGYCEEIEFLLHLPTGQIPEIYYNRYKHKRRPLVMFSFMWREGTWMHKGVPEMLFNIQRVMNEIVRDMLNNNKVKNAQIYVAKANGVIESDEPIFPGRVILTNDTEGDFRAVPMASGQISTSLQDMATMQSWAERADGMNEANLGREQRSRTPATTTLALLEEGNERVVSIIHRMRMAQTEVWTQVHQLYAQNGDGEGLDQVLGKEKAAKMRDVWSKMSILDIRKKLVLRAQVSTANLNRAVKRQENIALLAQMDQVHMRAQALIQIVQTTTSPVLRAMAIAMLKATQDIWERILNTYEIKYKSNMNPDLAKALAQLPPDPMQIAMQAAEGGEMATGQMDQAMAQSPEMGPMNAAGRPNAGMPRMDGGGG